jgi:hypothetical protein
VPSAGYWKGKSDLHPLRRQLLETVKFGSCCKTRGRGLVSGWNQKRKSMGSQVMQLDLDSINIVLMIAIWTPS